MHTVEKGQTLYAIARAYELKVNDIVIENPTSIDGIKPGQVLKIPFPKEKVQIADVLTKSDSSKFYFHQVQQGETLYSLSKAYSISIDKMKELNPDVKEGLKLGQTIRIPSDRIKANSLSKSETKEMSLVSPLHEPKPILGADTSKKMNHFNIGLFLPFRCAETIDLDIDNLVNGGGELPGKSTVAIQFYHGMQLAMDSLSKLGLEAKIHVYDMDEGDSMQFQNLLKNPELLSLNIMIGPLYTSDFVPLSKFARENKIFIVSPLSQQNKILFNNPYVSKVTASVTTQTEQMAKYVAQKYKEERIIVVNSGKSKDALLVKSFMIEANEAMKRAGADSVMEVRGFGGIGNFIQSSKTNIVVVPSADKAFVTDFITKLNTLREKNSILLFGLDCWTGFDNLDLDYLSNMQFHYPSSTYVDYDNAQVKNFIHAYASHYISDPGTFAFEGYDVGFYYLNMLRTYGINFQNKLGGSRQKGLQTGFDFYQVSSESGFENKAVFMLMYRDYKLVKAD